MINYVGYCVIQFSLTDLNNRLLTKNLLNNGKADTPINIFIL